MLAKPTLVWLTLNAEIYHRSATNNVDLIMLATINVPKDVPTRLSLLCNLIKYFNILFRKKCGLDNCVSAFEVGVKE